MKRKEIEHITRKQKYDASCINPWRGMANRAKTQGNKSLRQKLREDLLKRIEE